MSVYDKVFDKNILLDNIFFNVKTVTKHKDADEFKNNEPNLYEEWINSLYVPDENKNNYVYLNKKYSSECVYIPEYAKIVAITYAYMEIVDNKLKRNIFHIVDNDESVIIDKFFSFLNQKFIDSQESTPKFLHKLTGHNITNFDIPFLIKRFLILNANNSHEKILPPLFKMSISSKPWESNIIDTADVYRFGGNKHTSLSLISEVLGLKKTVTLEKNDVLSEKYWSSFENRDVVIKEIVSQSMNITNLVIQYLNQLKNL